MNRRLALFIALFLGWSTPVFAQASHVYSGPTLPTSCLVGDVYAKTGASPGLYVCLATNTWSSTGGSVTLGGAQGNIQINNTTGLGAYAGTSAAANQVVTGLDASGTATSSQVTNAMLAGSIQASKFVGTDIATVGTVTTGIWNGTKIDVAHGGTNLTAGTSGGVLAFTASGVLASSAALSANDPVVGGGAGVAPSSGSRSGNTTKFATMSGSVTSGNCIKSDASGNLVDFGGACGGSGAPGGADTQVQFNDSSSFGGNSGFTFNKTAHTAILTGTFKAAGYNNAYRTGTSTDTLSATDGVYECLSNAFTVNLPTAAGITGRVYTVKNLQVTNVCTVDPASAETIDGNATASVVNGSLTFQSDGTNWRSIGSSGIPIGVLTQGDMLYASAANTISSLAKSTSADRLVCNTGSSNNPAWCQADLTKAVTGILPAANGGTGANGTITLPTPVIFLAGVSQAGTASVACNTPGSGGATAATAATSVPTVGVASFSGSASNQLECAFITPSDWTAASTVDIQIYWRAASTSGDVNWQVATQFIGDGTVLNTAYNTASTVADTAKGTTLQVNIATITGVTATNIGASKLAFLKILRDGGVGADTMSGAAEMIGFIVTIRRTPTIGG